MTNADSVEDPARCWWVYLLACRDGRTYAGVALDVHARLRAHQAGKGARYTRGNPPVAILGMRCFASKTAAMRAEYALKQLSRAAKLDWADRFAPSAELSVELSRAAEAKTEAKTEANAEAK